MTIDPYIVNRAAHDYPQGGAPVLTMSRPGLRARSAAHAAFKVAEQHLSNVTAAARYEHPEIASDVLPEMRQALAGRLTERARGLFDSPLDGYLKVAERAHADADAAADKYRPKLDPESATQLVRTDQAWNNHIKPMLAAGKEWAEIIPTLDADGILAAQRFAPGYESSKRDRFHQHEVPSVIDGIEQMSARRVVDIAPPEGREALREALDTAQALEFTRNAAATVSEANDRNTTTLSINLKRNAHQASAQRPAATSPEAQAAYAGQLQAA